MAEYVLTNAALEDLNGIWEHTCEEWSEEQADKYYQILLDACQTIAENPGLGKRYEIIRPDLFGFIAESHLIFYRELRAESIEITRIMHGRMDLKSRLSE